MAQPPASMAVISIRSYESDLTCDTGRSVQVSGTAVVNVTPDRVLIGHDGAVVDVVEARAQNLEGLGFVFVLALFVLALDDDPRFVMSQANRRFGLIDVLTTRTTGPVRVDTQILFIDFYVNVVIKLRKNKNGSK